MSFKNEGVSFSVPMLMVGLFAFLSDLRVVLVYEMALPDSVCLYLWSEIDRLVTSIAGLWAILPC